MISASSAQEHVLHFLIGDLSLGHPPLGMHRVPVLCLLYNCANDL